MVEYKVFVVELDGMCEYFYLGFNIGSIVMDVIDVVDEFFEIVEWEVFEDEVEVLIVGREDG